MSGETCSQDHETEAHKDKVKNRDRAGIAALTAIACDQRLQFRDPVSPRHVVHALGFTLLVGEKHAAVRLQPLELRAPGRALGVLLGRAGPRLVVFA